MAGGRAAKLTENALYHRPLDQELWNPGDIARDALLAVGGTCLFGSAANALTGRSTNYFTAFLPRSFASLMPAREAARYRGYWSAVEGSPFIAQMSLDDAERYSQYWDEVAHERARETAFRAATTLGKLNRTSRPSKVSVVVNRDTGSMYMGLSGKELFGKSYPAQIAPELARRGAFSRIHVWEIFNCAEVRACNAALLNGSNISDLVGYTIDVQKLLPAPRCLHCQITTSGMATRSDDVWTVLGSYRR